jgi:hypothetical protein
MKARTPLLALALAAMSLLPSTARAIGIEDVVDGGNTYPWVRVELPGTVCSNGSQYRFWYYDSPTSNNMVISYEEHDFFPWFGAAVDDLGRPTIINGG